MSHYSPKELLERMLSNLGISAEVQEEMRPSGPTLHILSDEASFLIGDEGQVLEDLQYLLNRMLMNDEMDQPRVSIDIAGHRLSFQRKFLEDIKVIVDRVKEEGGEVTLDPMNSYERMLVHNTYKDDPGVVTSSPEGPERIKQIIVRKAS
ncbi:MAG: R3H domain-containing nucleic acid-binding protein [Verrucomicrobiota bacterium]